MKKYIVLVKLNSGKGGEFWNRFTNFRLAHWTVDRRTQQTKKKLNSETNWDVN